MVLESVLQHLSLCLCVKPSTQSRCPLSQRFVGRTVWHGVAECCPLWLQNHQARSARLGLRFGAAAVVLRLGFASSTRASSPPSNASSKARRCSSERLARYRLRSEPDMASSSSSMAMPDSVMPSSVGGGASSSSPSQMPTCDDCVGDCCGNGGDCFGNGGACDLAAVSDVVERAVWSLSMASMSASSPFWLLSSSVAALLLAGWCAGVGGSRWSARAGFAGGAESAAVVVASVDSVAASLGTWLAVGEDQDDGAAAYGGGWYAGVEPAAGLSTVI